MIGHEKTEITTLSIISYILCFRVFLLNGSYEEVASIYQTGSTCKCRNALAFDFTARPNLYFFVVLDLNILER